MTGYPPRCAHASAIVGSIARPSHFYWDVSVTLCSLLGFGKRFGLTTGVRRLTAWGCCGSAVAPWMYELLDPSSHHSSFIGDLIMSRQGASRPKCSQQETCALFLSVTS